VSTRPARRRVRRPVRRLVRRSLGEGGSPPGEDGSLGEGGAIVKKPVVVYIEKVYEEGDFAGLGIGA